MYNYYKNYYIVEFNFYVLFLYIFISSVYNLSFIFIHVFV